jgi:hypothetical protein
MRLSGQSPHPPRRERVVAPLDPPAGSPRLRIGALLVSALSLGSSLAVPLAAAAVGVSAVSVASDVSAARHSVDHLDASLAQVLQLGAAAGGPPGPAAEPAAALQAIGPGVQALSAVAQQLADAHVDYAAFAALAGELHRADLPKLIDAASGLIEHLDQLRVHQQISFRTDGLGHRQPGGEHPEGPSP